MPSFVVFASFVGFAYLAENFEYSWTGCPRLNSAVAHGRVVAVVNALDVAVVVGNRRIGDGWAAY